MKKMFKTFQEYYLYYFGESVKRNNEAVEPQIQAKHGGRQVDEAIRGTDWDYIRAAQQQMLQVRTNILETQQEMMQPWITFEYKQPELNLWQGRIVSLNSFGYMFETPEERMKKRIKAIDIYAEDEKS